MRRRKPLRLRGHNYGAVGEYFITICSYQNQLMFGDFAGENTLARRIIEDIFCQVVAQYRHVECPIYVIMPNHMHAILKITNNMEKDDVATISDIMQNFKRYSTLSYIHFVREGKLPPFYKHVWQRSFHDHIIRSQDEYRMILQYIQNNPLNWADDCFYPQLGI